MKFFVLKNSININLIGAYPQVIETYNADYIKKQKWAYKEEGCISLPSLPELVLDPEAGFTTFLNTAGKTPAGSRVFEKSFIEFLKGFKTQEFQSWNILTHQNKRTIEGYSLFRLCYQNKEYILDYKNSVFYFPSRYHHFTDKTNRTYVEINNNEDYEKLQKEKKIFYPEKLRIDLSKVTDDLFIMGHHTNIPEYIVSEKLKDAIKKHEKFTGFRFVEIKDRFNKEMVDFKY
ncbi:hypothetical protein [Aquimarina sp. 2201CG14-23]|uniref:hypothetical protein n=1 Tax=Aquimarina mycalae TaxID=3040073 RepID=UPI002477DBC4|nr:hypothetical protein [Aquimarina sp. 2201CG14-23]MDH7444518.1 hypothetical protein [Aquimarina sp. 2201CG14-23]